MAAKSALLEAETKLEERADRLQSLETERDQLRGEAEALQAALERAKQHVNILQTRRDQMRDEIAKLKLAAGRSE